MTTDPEAPTEIGEGQQCPYCQGWETERKKVEGQDVWWWCQGCGVWFRVEKLKSD